LKWYEGQLKKIPNITIKLGTEVNAAVVDKLKPDVVILSPGSTYELPKIPGIDSKNVVTTHQLKEKAQTYLKYIGSGAMSKLSKIYLPIGDHVAIVGGDLKGLEAAEFLVKRRKKVTVLEESDQLGEGMNVWIQFKFMPWMMSNPNITVHKGVKYEKIHDKGITVTTAEGKKLDIAADTVMIIEKDRKNYHLYDALKGRAPEIHIIGDAREDKNAWLEGTIHDAVTVGMKV
jgi:NADPH-dependent 2,4-dienoyl-CoA reductase/sulfur reductase-like enzyme